MPDARPRTAQDYLALVALGGLSNEQCREALSALPPEEQYRVKRHGIEALFHPDKAVLAERRALVSPSGKYRLVVTPCDTGPRSWRVTEGRVEHADGRWIATVLRNYGHMPFAWVENHPDGHDYLVTGEDYQGQTVVRLTTGERRDHWTDELLRGFATCWAEISASPDGLTLAVIGCVWGGPYELSLHDFSEPMGDLHQLSSADCEAYDAVEWLPDGSCILLNHEWCRLSDGTPTGQLPDEVAEALADAETDALPVSCTRFPRPSLLDGCAWQVARLMRWEQRRPTGRDIIGAVRAMFRGRLSEAELDEAERRWHGRPQGPA